MNNYIIVIINSGSATIKTLIKGNISVIIGELGSWNKQLVRVCFAPLFEAGLTNKKSDI